MEDKDARIAQLIQENQDLADLAGRLQAEMDDIDHERKGEYATLIESALIHERHRKEITTLNTVVRRRKRISARLRNVLGTIEKLHTPKEPNATTVFSTLCNECNRKWPCVTYQLIRPYRVQNMISEQEINDASVQAEQTKEA